ncbi:hypothetical protein ADIS_0023 [Lunatimonas lonarensis]|uniref:Uncharacterized protein n=1 Tax=Lunatimonas lonarensis TaxID=1232681 RepID=R7ZZD3_9BACT|nr:hypothetical protein ADIS_0023 [Lunatimonas lonarensis]
MLKMDFLLKAVYCFALVNDDLNEIYQKVGEFSRCFFSI